MVCKAFPTLKLNDVCLFLERLSGSSWANGKASACHRAGEVGKHFENYSGLCELEDYYYYAAYTRCPSRMHELNKETSCSLPAKLKAGMVTGLETLTRGATENTGYLI